MKVSKIELDSQKLEQLKRFSQSIFYRLFGHNFLESNSILKIFVSFDFSLISGKRMITNFIKK